MQRPTSLIRLLLSSIILAGIFPAAGLAQVAGLTITDAGRNASGRALYDIKADNADVIQVLKQLFSKANVGSVEMSPDIRQSVTLNVKGATADDLIERVRTSVTPPLYFMTNGRTVYVSRSATAYQRADELRRRMEGNPYRNVPPGIVPSGVIDPLGSVYRDQLALDKPVTLNVPDDKPITLMAALQLVQKQTGADLRMDSSLPSDVKFTGIVTRVPLRAFLQKLGEGSLKVVTTPNQLLIAPADRFSVLWNGTTIGSMEGCQRCRQPLNALWSYCPTCGQITRRGQLNPGTRKVPVRPE